MDLIPNSRRRLLPLFLIFILYLTVTELSFGELIGYWNLNDVNGAKDLSDNNNRDKIQGKPKSVAGKIKTAL